GPTCGGTPPGAALVEEGLSALGVAPGAGANTPVAAARPAPEVSVEVLRVVSPAAWRIVSLRAPALAVSGVVCAATPAAPGSRSPRSTEHAQALGQTRTTRVRPPVDAPARSDAMPRSSGAGPIMSSCPLTALGATFLVPR